MLLLHAPRAAASEDTVMPLGPTANPGSPCIQAGGGPASPAPLVR